MPDPGSLHEQRKSTIDKLLGALRAIDKATSEQIEAEANKPPIPSN